MAAQIEVVGHRFEVGQNLGLPSVGAAPQAKLAMVKMATQVIRKRLRPKRSENQLLAGRMIALATR